VANYHDYAEAYKLPVSFGVEWDDVDLVDSISQLLNISSSSLTPSLQLIGESNSLQTIHAQPKKMVNSSGSQVPDLVKWYQTSLITEASY
jgi:peptidyl-tRNA hydrolase